jgi:hypothetical protein
VNFIGGDVSFQFEGILKRTACKGISELGYEVINEQQTKTTKQTFSTISSVSSSACHLH